MFRTLKMAVLLFSVHPLPVQCLLHLYPMHTTDLPLCLPQAPAGDCSYQRDSEGRAPLLVSLVTIEPACPQFLTNWLSPLPRRNEDSCQILLSAAHSRVSFQDRGLLEAGRSSRR